MNKLLLQKRAEHQNHNNSLEYNHQKVKEKSPEKDKGYILSKIDETYGNKRFKLNKFNLQLFSGDNQNQELKQNFKYKNIKRMIKKEQIYVKDKKINKKKENSKESIITNNLILNKTESDYNYRFHTNITKYFKNCSISLKEKSLEYLESYLDTLWKKLGVNDNYITFFNSCKNMIINSEEKEIYIKNEIENLERFNDILLNLKKDIEMRENKLIEIKNLFDKLNKENDFNNIKKMLNESYSLIFIYIENSIRVVEYYLLYKEIINQGNCKALKFNEEIIKKNFDINKSIDANYLLKMKTDTYFLINLKTNEFKLNKDMLNLFKADPFLTCLNNIIQIPQETKEKVKYCHYYLLQEGFFDSLNKLMKEPKTNSARKNPQSHIKIDAGLLKKNLNHLNQIKDVEESKNPEENVNSNKNINKNIDDNLCINENLDISYYSGKLTEFIPIYSDYFEKIPAEQKIIFNLKEDPLKYFEHNFYPKIIICKDKVTNIIKGICIYSIIFKSHERKPNEIIIEHISSYNKEEMENILTKMIEFIRENHILKDLNKNENQLYAEIYIDLYYFLENEKFNIDKNIRDFISKKLKFKWVKLENISKEIRFQKMKQIIYGNNIKNSLNNSIFNSINCNIEEDNYSLSNNFCIRDNFVIEFIQKLIMDNQENKDINININRINPYNIFYIVYILKKIHNIKNSFEYLLNKINTFIISNKILKELPSISNENTNEMNLYSLPFDLKNITDCFNGNLNDELGVKNKIDIFPLFDGCISTKYDNYYYNRIKCNNIKILIENTTEQKFYLMKATNSENISILISSNLNDNFKTKYLTNINENSSNNNISLSFKEIYNNLIESEAEERDVNKYIYIPAFSIEQKYELVNINSIEPKEENILKDLNEEYKIEFLSEELIERKNNRISNNFEFDIIGEKIKNGVDYIINDEFMIFILDSDAIDNIGIIPIMSIDVHKENYITDTTIEY